MRLLLLVTFSFLVIGLSAQQVTKKRGTEKVRDENGKVYAKGKVRNQKKKGKWTYYDTDGKVVMVVYFTNDTVNGPSTSYTSSGIITQTGTYSMNKKVGRWETFDPNTGKLISVENFENGLQHGEQRFLWPNGLLRDSLVFDRGHIIYREGHYANGKLKAIEHYKNDLPEGTWTEYREFIDTTVAVDTFPSYRKHYRNGKLEGWAYEYQERKVVVAAYYTEGRLNGDVIVYNPDGTKKVVEKYVNGEKDGVTTHYRNDTKVLEQPFEKGLLHGKQIVWSRNNTVLKATWYNHGNIDSIISYFPNEKMAIREAWSFKAKKYIHEEWNEQGVFLVTGFVNLYGLRDSVWTSFYPDGKVRSVTHYSSGRLFGLFTKYYLNGKKMIEMNFLQDGRNTPPDVWTEKGVIVKEYDSYYQAIVEGNRPAEFYNDPANFTRLITERETKPGDEPNRRPNSDR